MYEPIFEGKEFSYSYDKETGVYLLYSDKYEISLPLKGDDAICFAEHIELLTRNVNNSFQEKIEKIICIHLYFSTFGITGDSMKIIPLFEE